MRPPVRVVLAVAASAMGSGAMKTIPVFGAVRLTTGRMGAVAVMVTGPEAPLLPSRSYALAVMDSVPTGGALQTNWYGAVVVLPSTAVPFRKSTRPTAPSGAIALAASVSGTPARIEVPAAG